MGAWNTAIDGRQRRVSEHLTFRDDGCVVAGEAFHGIDL
jgi:hypothetical protein